MWTAILGVALPQVFRALEKTFGPKTGDAKKATAVKVATTILDAAAAAGKLGAASPIVAEVSEFVEQLLSQEKAKPDWQEAATLSLEGRVYQILILNEVK